MIRIGNFKIRSTGLPVLLVSALFLAGCALPSGPASSANPASAPTPELHLTAASPSMAEWHAQLAKWTSADAILLGEQHDAAEHQYWEADTVRELAARKRLAAVVLEMADAGTQTTGLAPSATEAQVQEALRWNDKGWPWKAYGPAVMAAVQAGIPVLGGNLPRLHMAEAMKNQQLDQQLSAKAMQMQLDAIKVGHCDLLPESQLLPMARIQLAKDQSMARTIEAALKPGQTVLLLAGHGHVRRQLGVGNWLPAHLQLRLAIAQTEKVNPAIQGEADAFVVTPPVAYKDHCADLRKQWKR